MHSFQLVNVLQELLQFRCSKIHFHDAIRSFLCECVVEYLLILCSGLGRGLIGCWGAAEWWWPPLCGDRQVLLQSEYCTATLLQGLSPAATELHPDQTALPLHIHSIVSFES